MTTSNLNQVRREKILVVLSDGIEREIKFTLNAMADLEEKYGSVDAAFKELESGNIRAIRFFLWAAIVQVNGENLTERQIGDLIDVQSIGELMKSIERATKEDMQAEEIVADVVATEVSPN